MAQDSFPHDAQPTVGTTATDAPHHEPPANQEPLPNVTDKPAVKKPNHILRLAWLRAVLKVPFRALRSVRDSYVRGMTQCAGSSVAMAGGFSMGAAYPPVPRSYSSRSRSSEDDHSELIRAASQRMMATRVIPAAAVGPDGVQRSRSAVVWRIDEDKEAEFGSDGGAEFATAAKSAAFARSRSHAVAGTRAGGHSGSYFPPRRAGVAVA